MRKAFPAACIALCMGQMCIPGAPDPQGILPGLYAGQVDHSYTITGPEQETGGYTILITRNFGSHGGLLTVNGTPVDIGDGVQMAIGSLNCTVTVKGTQMSTGRVQVLYDVTGSGCDTDGCLTLAGISTELYTQTASNTLDFQAEWNLGYTKSDGGSGLARYFYNGTLTK
ncbi:MAG TPA: hypothetical protein VLM89_09450 [Phycisphaerae bacterium]|nr:hypothetical protein [Phycisphaerae bacterium]